MSEDDEWDWDDAKDERKHAHKLEHESWHYPPSVVELLLNKTISKSEFILFGLVNFHVREDMQMHIDDLARLSDMPERRVIRCLCRLRRLELIKGRWKRDGDDTKVVAMHCTEM